LLVEDLIIVENKAVEIMIPLYQAQLLSYLKLTGKPKDLLINFNSVNIKEQLVSLVTEELLNYLRVNSVKLYVLCVSVVNI
jgi:hypothetical protein